MAAIDLNPVRGTRDFYPEDMRLRQWMFDHWRAVAEQFAYQAYDSCVLESEELYIRKAGDEITGQLYNFTDKGGRAVALRPELTPSLARMVLGRVNSLSLPLRWYAIGQCFRYERMQRGRKREHYQWNMDIVGLSSVAAEVELMAAQATVLERLGLKVGPENPEIVFKVSDRRLLQGFLAELGIGGEQFAAVCVEVDKLDKIGPENVTQNLAERGVGAEHTQKILGVLAANSIEELKTLVGRDNAGLVSLAELADLAEASGIAHLIRIDPSVVRGLSYYTGTVWELFAASGDFQRAIAGGGRYDALLDTLGGQSQPMVGFGFGDVAIIEVLASLKRLPVLDEGIDDVVYPMSSQEFTAANVAASKLRAQGRQVLVDYSERRFKHVIKQAESRGARRLVIIGSEEAAKGVCTLRSIGGEKGQRSEEQVAFDEL